MMATDHATRIREDTLAEFLRLRRSRLTPNTVGLPPGRRRRTPGLRREEVADLAGIGASWYTALEQGRDVHPSDQVLRSLARALRLSAAETRHLFFLAGRPAPHELSKGAQTASPAVMRLLDLLLPQPAFVANRRWDWLAWNSAAEIVYDFAADENPRNALWHFFAQDGLAKDEVWERSARSMAARFRAQNATCVGDPWFESFVQDMMERSEDFRRVWQRHDVEDSSEVAYTVHHRRAGWVTGELLVLDTPSMPDAWIIVYLLDAGQAERLGLALA